MIEFLLNNIVFVVIILFAIFRVFAEWVKNEQKNQSSNEQQKPSQSSTKLPEIFSELKEAFEEASGTSTTKKAENTKNVASHENEVPRHRRVQQVNDEVVEDAEDLHKKQLEQLKQQYSASEAELKEANKNIKKYSAPDLHEKKSHALSKNDMKKHFTKQGLKESIVMMEVLGPPRALRPYRSALERRK